MVHFGKVDAGLNWIIDKSTLVNSQEETEMLISQETIDDLEVIWDENGIHDPVYSSHSHIIIFLSHFIENSFELV